jgi:Sortilin, neurotensin receptor 3,
MRWGRTVALAGALGVVLLPAAPASPLATAFSPARPVSWVSVAAGDPARVWVETAAGGFLSDDAGRSFRAPLSTAAFGRAQVAQATLLADGKTLVAMPAVWSAQRFSPPLWSADGGAHWRPGSLRGADAHYRFGPKPDFVGEAPVTADPGDPRTAWFCQGNLYVTHDAGRTWAVARPRFTLPWHCAAVAIAPGTRHTLLLLVQARALNPKRVPGKLLRSVDGGATWHRQQAPRYPQLDYNGHAIAFDPARPATALMIAADGARAGALYRSTNAGHSWKQVRPAGTVRDAVVDQFAFTSDGRTLALVRIRGLQDATFASFDGGAHWNVAPTLKVGTRSPAVYASPLAASGTSFLYGTNQRGFWRLATDARSWAAP